MRASHFVTLGLCVGVVAIATGFVGCGTDTSGTCSDTNTCGSPLGDGSTVDTSVDGPSSDDSGDDGMTSNDGGADGAEGGCTAPLSLNCNGTCVDPNSPLNCGSCGHTCEGPDSGMGQATCTNGMCSTGCSAPTSLNCGGSCVDPTKPANCGSCGNVCHGPTSGTGMGMGVCTTVDGGMPTCSIACSTGSHLCNGACDSNGDVPSNTSDPCVLNDQFGVFVSTSGHDTAGAGTAAMPYATVSYALGHLNSKARVYVCNGTYNEQASVTISGAVGVFGGLSCTGGTWSYVGGHALVNGPQNQPALLINAGSAAVDIEDMAFTAANASGVDSNGNGQSSIAALVNASSNVTFHRSVLTAGSGASASQTKPTTPANYTDGPTAPGGAANIATQGGAGGTASCHYGTSVGGSGGTVGMNSGAGGNGVSTPMATMGGTGFDGVGGAAKTSGDDGASGTAQAAGSAATVYGALTASGWTPKAGGNGLPGNPGQGGGGGGVNNTGTLGGTGGGAGGCGGGGGAAGLGGGASIALASVASAITLDSNCSLTAAAAGNGQPGGDGQNGQAGGPPGNAVGVVPGGSGGNGAGGSGGSGGTGGISVCIAYTSTAPASSASCTPGAAGQPGAAGAGGAAGDNGDGDPGAAGNASSTGLAGTQGTSLQVQ